LIYLNKLFILNFEEIYRTELFYPIESDIVKYVT